MALSFPLEFFTPSTTSYPSSHNLYISTIFSGGCCKSQSITTAQFPMQLSSPANIAASLPKFLEKLTPLIFLFDSACHIISSQVLSFDPSFINNSS